MATGAGAFAAEVVGIGGVGFDPAGAVLAVASIAAGARRRALTALVGGFLATMVLLGVASTALARAATGTRSFHQLENLVRAHHLVGWGELAVGAAALLAAVWVAAPLAAARHAPGPEEGDDDEPAPAPTRARPRLAAPGVLALGGAGVALSLVVDPGFAGLTVAAREQPAWQWVPAWLGWGALSQILLLAVWATVLVDRRGRALARISRAVRAVAARSRLLLVVLLGGAGVYLLVAGTLRLVALTPP